MLGFFFSFVVLRFRGFSNFFMVVLREGGWGGDYEMLLGIKRDV